MRQYCPGGTLAAVPRVTLSCVVAATVFLKQLDCLQPIRSGVAYSEVLACYWISRECMSKPQGDA